MDWTKLVNKKDKIKIDGFRVVFVFIENGKENQREKFNPSVKIQKNMVWCIHSLFLFSSSVWIFLILAVNVIFALVNTDIEDEESRQSLAENSLYATVQRSAKNIKTNDLLAVIKSMENNKDKGFSEEYNVRSTLFKFVFFKH